MTVKRTTKSAATVAKPEVLKAETPPPVAKPPMAAKAYIRLVNGCSTYVTPEREVFYARESQTQRAKVYEVPVGDLERLLGYRDDYNRKFFRQVETPDDGLATAPEDVRKAKIEETPVPAGDDFQKPGGKLGEDGEIDTGITRLTDKDGNPAGVTV